MKIRKPNTCPHCPPQEVEWPEPGQYDPNCICNKPMLLYIPPGQHIHCPSHPDVVMRGSDITCTSFGDSVTNSGLMYSHDASKDLTYDSTRPFGTATGQNISSTKIIC